LKVKYFSYFLFLVLVVRLFKWAPLIDFGRWDPWIGPGAYGKLAILFMFLGILTGFIFVVFIETSPYKTFKDILLRLSVASFFMGFGILFLLLSLDIYF